MGRSLKGTRFYRFLLKSDMLKPRILTHKLHHLLSLRLYIRFSLPVPHLQRSTFHPYGKEDLQRWHDFPGHITNHMCGLVKSLSSPGLGLPHLSCKNKPSALKPFVLGEEEASVLGPHSSLPWRTLWGKGRMVASSPTSHSSLCRIQLHRRDFSLNKQDQINTQALSESSLSFQHPATGRGEEPVVF